MMVVDSRTLDSADIQRLAERLYDDERAARAGAPLSDAHPDMTVADAYAVQLGYVAARTAAGARIAGPQGRLHQPGHPAVVQYRPAGLRTPARRHVAGGWRHHFDAHAGRPARRTGDCLRAARAVARTGRHPGRTCCWRRPACCRASRSSTVASRIGGSSSSTPSPTTAAARDACWAIGGPGGPARSASAGRGARMQRRGRRDWRWRGRAGPPGDRRGMARQYAGASVGNFWTPVTSCCPAR